MTDRTATGPSGTPGRRFTPTHLQDILAGGIATLLAGNMQPDALAAIAAAARAYAELQSVGEMKEQLAALQADMQLMAMRSPASRNH